MESSSSLRRSSSQSHVNKPSQDLLGLTLHPIDPIDPGPGEEKSGAAEVAVTAGKVDISGTGLDTSTSSGTNKGNFILDNLIFVNICDTHEIMEKIVHAIKKLCVHYRRFKKSHFAIVLKLIVYFRNS